MAGDPRSNHGEGTEEPRGEGQGPGKAGAVPAPRRGASRRGPPPKRRSLRRSLGLFLLVNILPLGAGAFIGVQYLRGEIAFRELPEGIGFNLAVLGGAVVVLVLVASFSLPAAHRVVVEIGGRMAYRSAILAGEREGSRLLSLLLLPLLAVPYALVWPVRLVLILVALALIAVILVFLVRLFEPDFLQEAVEVVLRQEQG